MTYSKIPIVATAVGCLLLAASAGLNINAALESGQPILSPTVLGIVALVIGQATAICAGQFAWHRGLRVRSFLAFFALGCAEFYGLYTGGERLLTARQYQAQPIAQINQAFDIAAQRVKVAEDAFRRAEDAATAEARRGGCGRACRDLREASDRANDELETARTTLARTPLKRPESVVASVTGWPTALVEITPALLFTLGLNGLAFALLAIGEGGTEPVQRRKINSAGTRLRRTPKARVQRHAGSGPSSRPSSVSRRSEQVSKFCREFRAQFGREPTFTEVRQGTQLPKATVSRALARVRVQLSRL